MEQLKHVTDVKNHYTDLWNKTTATQDIWCQLLFLYLAENLQCLFNIVHKVVYRSELVNQNINLCR